jgi:hypothetical protein
MLIITLHNDGTGDLLTGNYDYKVYINDRLLARGRVEDHPRDEGYRGLIKALAGVVNDAEESPKAY